MTPSALTSRAAAALLGVCLGTLRAYRERGILEATWEGNGWAYSRESMEALKAKRDTEAAKVRAAFDDPARCTVDRAAGICRCSEARVRDAIACGVIQAKKVGGRWLMLRADAERLAGEIRSVKALSAGWWDTYQPKNREELRQAYSRAMERASKRWGPLVWAGWVILHRERCGGDPPWGSLGERQRRKVLEIVEGVR